MGIECMALLGWELIKGWIVHWGGFSTGTLFYSALPWGLNWSSQGCFTDFVKF